MAEKIVPGNSLVEFFAKGDHDACFLSESAKQEDTRTESMSSTRAEPCAPVTSRISKR
jgi:hypothetical protein